MSNERNQKIYELRTEYKMTLAAIGRRFNISRERVRQIVRAEHWKTLREAERNEVAFLVSDLDLSARTRNCLGRTLSGDTPVYFMPIWQFLIEWNAEELMQIQHFGVACLTELREKLQETGYDVENLWASGDREDNDPA